MSSTSRTRSITAKATGLDALDSMKAVASGMDAIIANSVNRTATWSKREAERGMRKLTAFPSGYLSGNRLGTTRARFTSPTASIVAKFRPTLLTTFAKNAPSVLRKRRTPMVEVTPGSLKSMGGAFWIRLPNGTPAIAMRAEDYRSAYGQLTTKPFGVSKGKNNIVILYSPSIDQSFWIEGGRLQGDIGDHLAAEIISEIARKGL